MLCLQSTFLFVSGFSGCLDQPGKDRKHVIGCHQHGFWVPLDAKTVGIIDQLNGLHDAVIGGTGDH